MEAEQHPLWLAHIGGIFPRYGALSLCVGLIPGQGRAAPVRLSRALVVDMGGYALQLGIYPDSGVFSVPCISCPATIACNRPVLTCIAFQCVHMGNHTVQGTRAL